jgi:hypothetical protein
MTRRSLLAALAILSCYAAPNFARANLVQNGDFATGNLSGWTLTDQLITVNNGQVSQVTDAMTTAILNNSFNLPEFIHFNPIIAKNMWADGVDSGYGAISQSIPTTPGHTYRIDYVFGERLIPSPGTLLAMFGGNAFLPKNTWISCLAGLCPAPSDALQKSPPRAFGPDGALFYFPGLYVEGFTDTATSDLTTLEFAGSSLAGELDVTDIVVSDITAVPEPPSIALFAAGLLGFGMIRHNRRSAKLA